MRDIKLAGLNFSDEDIASILNGSRSYKQFLEMIEWIREGVCKFCPEHRDPKLNKVICKKGVPGFEWVMWHNPYSHSHTSGHLIIAPERHITHIMDMTKNDWQAIGELSFFAMSGEVQIDVSGGGFVMRYGNPARNASSIRHLHANIIIPDETGNVKATLAKDLEKIASTKKRVRIFEKLRQSKVEPGDDEVIKNILTEEEFNHVKERL
ncbi:MAG: hypothetical protein WD552_01230 [Candidatus Paceibacterota bacterium]